MTDKNRLISPGLDQDGEYSPPGPEPALYLVATPIGNLGDITDRAKKLLQQADVIACEDTRVTGKLCQAWNLKAPMIAYHEHSAARVRPQIIERIKKGEVVALVSDAGTPLVSDPGYKLVQTVIEEGLEVTALPGASAPTTALLLSGLPSDRYFFHGFLPNKSGARKNALDEIKTVPSTLIFFEGPSRLADSLADMAAVLGNRPAAVARELTKKFEEVRRGPLEELADHYRAGGNPKGEIVVVVGAPLVRDEGLSEEELDAELKKALEGASLKDAVASVSGALGLPRKQVYKRALALIKGDGG
ncbi:16S rRNA (cytidine(1402)-2'-O)-methyltransferase [Kiloniella sp. b19]|uniref:16S rRNA (cytidine(1402)-2'-O)-methyltransferase n=1 Tax=Kiloniella sp. GXU_MW_B19 TaxID=3141326 RepID=UPI0031CFB5EA